MKSPWLKWQLDRQLELTSKGMGVQLAQKLAEREATGRRRVGLYTGFEAAAKADLVCEELPDGRLVWRIFVDPQLVPEHRRAAAAQYFFPKWAIHQKL